MVPLHQRVIPWTVPLLMAAVVGCGSGGPALVPVTGVLTYKGKPVANAGLRFLPEAGRPSSGQTDEEGRFTLSYDREHEGAVMGKHKVWVTRMPTRPTTKAEQEAAIMGRKTPLSRDLSAFFDKYGEKNSKVEVVIDKNTKELKLDWD